MKKLEILTTTGWLPVFCCSNGRPITLTQANRSKALPSLAWHGASDLKYFANKFANDQFRIA